MPTKIKILLHIRGKGQSSSDPRGRSRLQFSFNYSAYRNLETFDAWNALPNFIIDSKSPRDAYNTFDDELR